MEKYIKELVKLAKKAFINDDVPVGAIVVYNGKIIGRGYNKKSQTNSVLDHAELIAIREASKKIKDWRLNECELYVTLEPCNMCKEAIKQSRIKAVKYLIESNFYNEKQRETDYQIIENKYDQAKQEYEALLKNFFKNKR